MTFRFEISEVELPAQLQNDQNGGKSSGIDQVEITKVKTGTLFADI